MKNFELDYAEKEKRFLETVIAIREQCFANGKPYLMLSEDLQEGESYWEYADRIEIQCVTVTEDNKSEFRLVRVLEKQEADKVRANHGL